MTSLRLALVALAAASVLGCGGRLHMGESYGRATRTVFARQVANPNGPVKPPSVKGLDAQEASAVVETYRKQLAPRDSNTAERQMLIVAPQGAAGGLMPAPSIPPGR